VERGLNTKPGFLVWHTFFDYILYNAIRVYLYFLTEKKLFNITSFKQFQDKRKNLFSFKNFLDDLYCCNSFSSSQFEKYYPGLKERYNKMNRIIKEILQRKESYEEIVVNKNHNINTMNTIVCSVIE